MAASLIATLGVFPVQAETGYEGWLRYAELDRAAQARYRSLPAVVVRLGNSPVIASAQHELVRGVRGMLGRTLREERDLPHEAAIVLATFAELRALAPELKAPDPLRDD